MKILLLGVGMQGRAALHDLSRQNRFTEIVAADADIDGLRGFVKDVSPGSNIRCEQLDIKDDVGFARLLREKPDVVLDLLPAEFVEHVARKTVTEGLNLVNTCFVRPEIRRMASVAEANGTAILPQFGVDPGIDLLLLGDAVDKLDEVREIRSYGAGIPEPAISNCNPLRYKVTWTLEGVLNAYSRPAQQIVDGDVNTIPGNLLFDSSNVHCVDVESVGKLEAYPNGDATKLAEEAGVKPAKLDHLGCYTMRWPGHAAFWKPLVDLGFLEDKKISVDGRQVSRKKFLAAVLAPATELGRNERDVVIVRVEVKGRKNGKPVKIVNQMIDWRDLATGFTAMSRTVGFTAAIGATLIASGKVKKTGLLKPARDVPFEFMKEELAKRGIPLMSEVD